jgi:hypothetical protein
MEFHYSSLREIPSSVQIFNGFEQKNLVSIILGQPLQGDFNLMVFLESLKVSIPSDLGFYCKLNNSKGSLRTLLVALMITVDYLMSSSFVYSLQQKSFNPSPGLENYKTSTCLCTPFMALCYTHTSTSMRTTISLLIFSEVKLRTCQHTLCILSLHSLQELSRQEKIETHSPSLKDFIHSIMKSYIHTTLKQMHNRDWN